MSNDSRKIYELESIRGLAALLVVFYHLPKWNPILDIKIINNGYLMVELFFVISGFVIFNAYNEKISTRSDLLKFQFLRFGRLYPVHFIFLSLFLLIEIGKYYAVSKYGVQNINATPFGENSIEALIEQVFLIQAVFPNGHATTFNPPAWSISVEFYTYLIFGLTILLFKQHKIKAMSLLMLISMFLLIFDFKFGYGYILRCLAGFFLGCLTAYILKKITIKPPTYVSLLIFFLLLLFLQIKISNDFDFLIFFLTAALILSLILTPTGWLNSIMSNKVFVWLGEISYSVYMSHAFIIWGVSNFFKRLVQRPEIQRADGSWAALLSIPETIAAMFVVSILVLFISHLLYVFIERPLRNRARNYVFSQK